jgi:hypothetical protein
MSAMPVRIEKGPGGPLTSLEVGHCRGLRPHRGGDTIKMKCYSVYSSNFRPAYHGKDLSHFLQEVSPWQIGNCFLGQYQIRN